MASPSAPNHHQPKSENISFSNFPRRRELIVVARPDAQLRATPQGVQSLAGADVGSLSDLLKREGATMKPLFGSEDAVQFAARALVPSADNVPDLSVYYHVEAPDEKLDALAEELRSHGTVEAAYVKPPAEPAVAGVMEQEG